MSVSIAVEASHGHSAAAVRSPLPWAPPQNAGLGLSGAVMQIAADREIYAEGDETDYFYKVTEGTVRTCRFLSDGRRQIDAFHMDGEVFGLEAGGDHRMTAEAVTDCALIAYRRRGLEAMLFQDDLLSQWFFSHAMTAMASTREHSLLLARASAVQKIAAFLQEIAQRQSSKNVVDLAMSRQDIADYLGLTIETVSRTLSHLERDKTIALPAARHVVLQDRRALQALLG